MRPLEIYKTEDSKFYLYIDATRGLDDVLSTNSELQELMCRKKIINVLTYTDGTYSRLRQIKDATTFAQQIMKKGYYLYSEDLQVIEAMLDSEFA